MSILFLEIMIPLWSNKKGGNEDQFVVSTFFKNNYIFFFWTVYAPANSSFMTFSPNKETVARVTLLR